MAVLMSCRINKLSSSQSVILKIFRSLLCKTKEKTMKTRKEENVKVFFDLC